MTITITSVDRVVDPDELSDILRDYLGPVVEAFRQEAGLDLEVAPVVRATMDNLGAYLPPDGRLFLARDAGDRLVGTIFLKRIRPDAAEIKRLFVRPEARGTGLGRRLSEAAIAEARAMGMRSVLIDTSLWQTAAQALYSSMGFRDVPRYPESENDISMDPWLVYMELMLGTGSQGTATES
ncbi:GNAT family N-acetyltransferase [Palleronia sp. KMU-117]|uniref:GNAT family N-acetyltransferase n=1 Tax=Palleronia sp. KMU-117 TaxID=3434108 RepID=UPI003D744A74